MLTMIVISSPQTLADEPSNRAGGYNSTVTQTVVGSQNNTAVYNYPPFQPIQVTSKKDRPPAPIGYIYADELPNTIFGTPMFNSYGYLPPSPPAPPLLVPLPGPAAPVYGYAQVPIVIAPTQVAPKVPPLCKKCKKPSCKHKRHTK